MARTLNEIKQDIYSSFLGNTTLEAMYGFNPTLPFENQFSKLSFEYNIIDIIAFAIYLLQELFGAHKTEVQNVIASTTPGRPSWYKLMTMNFQFGYALVPDEIYYDNTGIDNSLIEASKVVKYCAATGNLRGVRIKVAGENSSGVLEPLTNAQAVALVNYLEQIKYAGVRIQLVNEPADLLKCTLQIHYDPLVLDSNGARLDGTSATPVQDAVDEFLKTMQFNGVFTEMALVDALQQVEGVVIPHVESLAAKYASVSYITFEVSYLPVAGYLRVGELNITYVPFNS